VPSAGEQLPLGEPLCWRPARAPAPIELSGKRVLLRPLEPRADADELYRVSHAPDGDQSIWTYLPEGPYPSLAALRAALLAKQRSRDPLFFAIVPRSHGTAQGVAALLRIKPEHGAIEVGHIWFGPALRRTAAATEAIYLLARHALDELGYRRLEWKCDALNARSRSAAERLGFRFEGVFARHMVIKGRNRDTAWYAITDLSWPRARAALEAWLDDGNFDEHGRQRRRLAELRAALT
jgi:RimJ/RimL family protein N-acetyltransferase